MVRASQDTIQTEQMKRLFDSVESHAQRTILSRKEVQIMVCVDIFSYNSPRYIALSRKNGAPFLLEYTNRVLYGTVLDWNQYKDLLKQAEVLSHMKYGVIVTVYHAYTIKELLKINSLTWPKYVLRLKSRYKEHEPAEADDTLYDATLKMLQGTIERVAVYHNKEYAIGYDLCDYVVTLDEKRHKQVDLREISDVYKKEFYATIKGAVFQVGMVSGNTVFLLCRQYEQEKKYGFRWKDPREIGPGWETELSSVRLVKYKKISVYETIVKGLE